MAALAMIFLQAAHTKPEIRSRPTTLHVIYQTRETVFHRDIQTPRRELKIRRAAEYF